MSPCNVVRLPHLFVVRYERLKRTSLSTRKSHRDQWVVSSSNVERLLCYESTREADSMNCSSESSSVPLAFASILLHNISFNFVSFVANSHRVSAVITKHAKVSTDTIVALRFSSHISAYSPNMSPRDNRATSNPERKTDAVHCMITYAQWLESSHSESTLEFGSKSSTREWSMAFSMTESGKSLNKLRALRISYAVCALIFLVLVVRLRSIWPCRRFVCCLSHPTCVQSGNPFTFTD